MRQPWAARWTSLLLGAKHITVTKVKKHSLVLLLFLLSNCALMAQVQEFWTTGITNTVVLDPSPPPDASLTNYVFTEGTVDQSGNTIVVGIAHVNVALDSQTRSNFSAALVEKFSSRGEPLWTYFKTEDALIEGLETDLAGNIFFIAASNSVERSCALVKLSPDGDKLWQVSQNEEAVFPRPAATIRTDYAGNAYFLVLRIRGSDPSNLEIHFVLSKIEPRGTNLWTQVLPWDGKPLDVYALSKALSVFPDGSIAAAGANTIWKLDPLGRIQWTTPNGYPNILVSPKGTICATSLGQAYAVFSREGRMLESGTGLSGLAMDVQGVSPQSNFLLAYYGVIEELSANGRERWRNIIRLSPLPGALPAKGAGWFVLGGDGGMNLVRLDKGGSEISRTSIPAYIHTGDVQIRKPLHRAPDGTIRVIYDLRNSNLERDPYGVAITAFQERR
jgi:hypothetical protein